MTAPRSLELFFVDGRPDGMLTAEVFNWTGHVLRIPRAQIKDGLARAETARTGVYILIGAAHGRDMAYVGEAEDMRTRLAQHVSGKDWWDTAIVISTTGDMLHKAHAKYLESGLVEIARAVRIIDLENTSTPPRSSLSEAAQANMESFLETLNIVLPAIRVDMFLNKARTLADPAKAAPGAEFVLRSKKHGLAAQATLVGGEMVVRAGSTARKSWASSVGDGASYHALYSALVANSTLVPGPEAATFSTDYAFSSPSAAAAIIHGRPANGRIDWRHATSGITFADWESSQLEAAS